MGKREVVYEIENLKVRKQYEKNLIFTNKR